MIDVKIVESCLNGVSQNTLKVTQRRTSEFLILTSLLPLFRGVPTRGGGEWGVTHPLLPENYYEMPPLLLKFVFNSCENLDFIPIRPHLRSPAFIYNNLSFSFTFSSKYLICSSLHY